MQQHDCGEDPLKLVIAVASEHIDAASGQGALRKAGNETKQQKVESVAVHVGKSKVFPSTGLYKKCSFLDFYVLQTEFLRIEESKNAFYVLQADFLRREVLMSVFLKTFASPY